MNRPPDEAMGTPKGNGPPRHQGVIRLWYMLRTHRILFLLALLLALSLTINVAGMVRYKRPRSLWGIQDVQPPPRPPIPLSLNYKSDHPPPALNAPSRFESVQQLRDWQSRGRSKLLELLAVTLPKDVPPVRLVNRESTKDIIRETLVFEQADGLEVPAFLLRPDDDLPRPGLLAIPGHSQGILATAGLFEDYQHQMALKLAEAGYVVLTMEVRGFGYLHPDNSPEAIEPMAYTGLCLIRGTTRLGLTVSDAVAALNYLQHRREVQTDKLGVVGFSSGCDAAIYLGAVDDRVSTLVADSCVCSHESNFQISRNDPYEAVPSIANWLEMSDCLGLLSPRPVLVHWGANDTDPTGRSAAFNQTSIPTFEAAKRIYEAEGKGDQLEHFITPDMRHEFDVNAASEFLARRLPLPRR